MESSNNRFVTIKSDRVCKICSQTILRGTRCLTVNPKFGSRYWVCNDCFSLYRDIATTRASLDNSQFDDEDSVLADIAHLAELESELM